MGDFKNYYHTLGVGYGAAPQQVDSAWRKKVFEFRPDINTDLETRAKFIRFTAGLLQTVQDQIFCF